ncbi:hypothetical protein HOI18_04035, partial [Candidatus Uhrbacteria bacterium]|nr:hypothetical protein [Candidatus Uhrbacteria bacterium]
DTEGRMLLEEGDKIRLALKAFEDAYRRVRTSGENMLDDNTTNILRRCAAVPGMKRSLSHIRRGLRHKTLKHPENVPTFKRLRLSLLILARSLDRRQGIYLKWLKKKRARDARGNRHVR